MSLLGNKVALLAQC